MKGENRLNENKTINITSIRDRIFKEIFHDERNKELLKVVIETCLKINIKGVRYIPTELPQGNYQIKGKTMDILLDTDKGKINVELNARKNPYTNSRNFSYICNVYIRNTLVGQDYGENIDVIQINLSFGLGINGNVCEEYLVMNKRGKRYIKNLKIYEFNMDKIMEFWYSKNERMIKKYKYLIMLGLNSLELEELASEDKRVEEYMKTLDSVTVSIGINDWIDEETDQRFIRNTIEREATRKGIQKGLKQGLKEGRKEGLRQGQQEGLKQGLKQVAEKLIKEGMPIEKIASIYNMSIEELESLLKQQ